jgi:hypothetical protein
MPSILFKCPFTREYVTGWVADDPADSDKFETIKCLSCARVHVVNPKTGKVLGTNDE